MKINSYLCLGVALLSIAHLAYTVQNQVAPLQGNYFSSGIVIPSTGKVLDYSIRLQANDDKLYYYNRFYGSNMEFIMHFSSSLFGSARMISDGALPGLPSEKLLALDRDIAFNYTYIGRPNSKLTLYRLKVESGCKCYYIREISLPICPGADRVRNVNQ